jgi:hypothetical protein
MSEIWFNPDEIPVKDPNTGEITFERYGSVFSLLDVDGAEIWHNKEFPASLRLGEVMLADEIHDIRTDFELQSSSDFDRERCAAVGRTIIMATKNVTGKYALISYMMLERAYAFGLGPHASTYFRHDAHRNRRFAHLEEIKNAAGFARRVEPYRFDSWSRSKIKKRAAKIESDVGGMPRYADYEYAASIGHFPSRTVLRRLIGGGYSVVNEWLGYPFVPGMDDYAHLDYGRDFLEINGIEKFLQVSFDILAGKKRGPGRRAIQGNFGSFEDYRENVIEHIINRQQKISHYEKLLQEENLPSAYKKLTDDNLLQRGARYEFIESIAQWMCFDTKLKIANCRDEVSFVKEFSAQVLGSDMQLTPGHLELMLDYSPLKKYMWHKPAYYRKFIYVTDQEIAEAREVKNLDKRNRRAQQKLVA